MSSYLSDYLRFRLSRLLGGQHESKAFHLRQYRLHSATIKNAALNKDLALSCKEKGGLLTYSEYLEVEQFGKHGYHATHDLHGKTATPKLWPEAILSLLKTSGLEQVIELGSGDGELGERLLRLAKKRKMKIRWTGIEINREQQKKSHTRLRKFDQSLWNITESTEEISYKEPILFLFPYSLDSIPPEILINTGKSKSSPTDLVGLTIEENRAVEVLLTQNDLKQRGISLMRNCISLQKKYSFDLRDIKLFPMQRLYFPVHALAILIRVLEHLPQRSRILIIDEFRPPLSPDYTGSIATPKSLHSFIKPQDDNKKAYSEAGEHLLYYPYFLKSYISLFSLLGFTIETIDLEKKLACTLAGKKWHPEHVAYLTAAILTGAKKQTKLPETISLPAMYKAAYFCY